MKMQSHLYGPQLHLIDNPFLSGVLAKLCSPEVTQPAINRLVEILYQNLIETVVNHEFEITSFQQPTRMTALHPQHFLSGHKVSLQQSAVVVNLARAGTWPSHVCYDFLHDVLPAENLRQDHIMAARQTDENEQVTGAKWSGYKIGGGTENAHVLFPDPMGATGNTLVSAVEHYKKHVSGQAKKYIAIHLIITPEYLKRVLAAHPDLKIFALRLDRGLSPRHVLETLPGTHWDLEKGLNDKQYIVPGGGGFGEIMNNSYV